MQEARRTTSVSDRNYGLTHCSEVYPANRIIRVSPGAYGVWAVRQCESSNTSQTMNSTDSRTYVMDGQLDTSVTVR
jgi:hypothetical protein